MIRDAALRAARRERVFEMMDEADVDVLVLGRRDSVAYATGARSLWTAGTRPFGAACVMVLATGATHLLSTWDTGVPPEVPFDQLYGITWNPATMATALTAIDGLADAARIGVDALSPGFQRAAGRLAPRAELVPIDDRLRAIRAVKLPAEIARIRAANVVAQAAVDAALAAGPDRREALAAIARTMATNGTTIPSSAPRVDVAENQTVVDVGVLVDGYEGGAGRASPGDNRTAEIHSALVAACRPGATTADLTASAEAATSWTVRGVGMGYEPLLEPLEPGMVLSVAVDHHRDLVLVTPDGVAQLAVG